MTTEAGTNHLVMIYGVIGQRSPWRWPRQVTGITQVCGINVIRRFSTGNAAVMATGTGTYNMAMIHGGLSTIHHCLQSGTPCLLLPHHVEQAQNALRAEEIGIGRNLLGEGLKGEAGCAEPGAVVKRLKVFLSYHEQIGNITIERIRLAVERAAADHGWRTTCDTIANQWRPRFQRHSGAQAIAAAIREQLG